jgi:ribonuclease T1
VALTTLLFLSFNLHSKQGLPQDKLENIAFMQLPREAQQTQKLILAGGPFPFSKDASIFGNRERLLPVQQRGFYLEYTVKTPGSSTRGGKRIVCGGALPVRPQSCYYTEDHYQSFRKIVG